MQGNVSGGNVSGDRGLLGNVSGGNVSGLEECWVTCQGQRNAG